jgi:GxxExxY protein
VDRDRDLRMALRQYAGVALPSIGVFQQKARTTSSRPTESLCVLSEISAGVNSAGVKVMREDIPLLHADLTGRVIRVYWQVLNELGFGFLEEVVQRALVLALREAGFVVRCRVPMEVRFRGQVVGSFFADVVVNGVLLLEIKTGPRIEPKHISQTLNYLRASDLEIALILLFGPTGDVKRLVFSNTRKAQRPVPPQQANEPIETVSAVDGDGRDAIG